MRSKYIKSLAYALLVLTLLVIAPVSCDFITPQNKFRLAIPKSEFFYNYMAKHLKPFLESKGYYISVVPAENTTEACRMVADGEAELTLVNSHSTTIAVNLAGKSDRLRTVMPLTTRVLFVFSKNPIPDSTTARKLLENKRIGVEQLGGETHLTLIRLVKAAQINISGFVTFEDNPDVVIFWDKYYGDRAAGWMRKGWHPYSFRQNFVEFVGLIDHALRPFNLPALPGDANTINAKTLATDVILVANESMGENAGYLLAYAIFQNKVDLMHRDTMYNSIKESFDKETLLFPLHDGTFAYLLRDQPTFFVQYADSLALAISMVAVLYSAFLAIQNKLRRNQKERIDVYFLEFLEIRSSKTYTEDERLRKLDELFQRAVIQMTTERLDKGDFHIFSRLIQQDMTMMRFGA